MAMQPGSSRVRCRCLECSWFRRLLQCGKLSWSGEKKERRFAPKWCKKYTGKQSGKEVPTGNKDVVIIEHFHCKVSAGIVHAGSVGPGVRLSVVNLEGGTNGTLSRRLNQGSCFCVTPTSVVASGNMGTPRLLKSRDGKMSSLCSAHLQWW